jgi:hypothetical protein
LEDVTGSPKGSTLFFPEKIPPLEVDVILGRHCRNGRDRWSGIGEYGARVGENRVSRIGFAVSPALFAGDPSPASIGRVAALSVADGARVSRLEGFVGFVRIIRFGEFLVELDLG